MFINIIIQEILIYNMIIIFYPSLAFTELFLSALMNNCIQAAMNPLEVMLFY